MTAVIINCFETYEERVGLLKRALKSEGYEVCIYTSDYLHIKKEKRNAPGPDFTLFHACPYKKNLSFSRLRSHAKLAKDIFSYLNNKPVPELIWVFLPPNSFAQEAAAYKKTHSKVKLIFDVIDLWPEGMPIGIIKQLPPGRLWRSLRNRNLPFADCIVTECNRYRSFMGRKEIGSKAETIYMARPEEHFELTFVPPEDGKISLCYLGSINHLIDIELICKVIQAFKKKKDVVLHVIGDGDSRKLFLESAEEAGAEIVYHGILYDREEKRRIMSSCHYGLNIMKKSVCVGFTLKSMDYFEFGLPLINNLKGDTFLINEKYNTGINIDENVSEFKEYSPNMRENARSFFCDNLTEDRFDERIHDVIMKLG